MIALFVLKLIAGICLMWWLMPRRDVTDGFFRIQMRLVLGLAVLAILLLSRAGTWELPVVPADVTDAQVLASAETASQQLDQTRRWQQGLQIVVAVLAYAGSVFWALGRRTPGNLCIHLITLLCCAAVALHSLRVPCDCYWLQLWSDFSSAAVCGSVLTGMLLGHWYLTTPSMSITPLWWFNRAVLLAGLLRLAASGTAVATYGADLPELTHWIWAGIRWLGTGVVPLIVSLLVWQILKYRNTQSATGVLFAGLILVLMGEMSGALLERDLHIPY